MNILDHLKNDILYLDGAMGTVLQEKGLEQGESPEEWMLNNPGGISEVHRSYYDAGANVVYTNTFGANGLKFGKDELERIISAAVYEAKKARDDSNSPQEKWVGLDIGPSGRMLEPYGDLGFEEAVELFAEIVRRGVKEGVDMLSIETMNDSYETKAALLACKENSDLPVFVTNAYQDNGRLMTGADPVTMTALLEGLGADAIGANCSFGPEKLAPVIESYLKHASVPVIMKPNAGLPKVENGKAVYDMDAVAFSGKVRELMSKGVRVAGGCCGTSPEYIEALVSNTKDIRPSFTEAKEETIATSYSGFVSFGEKPVLIGERINPTGKKALREALLKDDLGIAVETAIAEDEEGADAIDVNAGAAGADEEKLLPELVSTLQEVCDRPFSIDTGNYAAMEKTLRIYNGKAIINSVNGKKESMESVFPLVKKYGGVVIALTLDEDGIPETAVGRYKVAEKILDKANEYGIDKKDIVFDPLTLTISSDNNAALVTLEAVRMIHEDLGARTSLGVSNVSFGLPNRENINRSFFMLAMKEGLDAAILDTGSKAMMDTYHSFLALNGKDPDFKEYIANVSDDQKQERAKVKGGSRDKGVKDLKTAVIKGAKAKAKEFTEELIKTRDGLAIIEDELIPSLDEVGKGFEKREVYLPELLMSAEAAEEAFSVIKRMSSEGSHERAKVVIATVKGDIHDIGKNIVKLILQNYGFDVVDLGRDVPCETILESVKKEKADILGLSALMTSTVGSMKETIEAVRKGAPSCLIMVGGAVLTEEYAKEIGADFYGKDAMASVRFCEANDRK